MVINRHQYTIEFKIKIVEEYRSSNKSAVEIAEEYGLTITTNRQGYRLCSIISNWNRSYEKGILKLSNAIAVSHRNPTGVNKAKSITINGDRYIEYTKPSTTIINIDGTDYIKDK